MSGLERISPAPKTIQATPPSMNRESLSVPASGWLLFSAPLISFRNGGSDFLLLPLQNLVDDRTNHSYRFAYRPFHGSAQSNVPFLATQSGGPKACPQKILQTAIHR